MKRRASDPFPVLVVWQHDAGADVKEREVEIDPRALGKDGRLKPEEPADHWSDCWSVGEALRRAVWLINKERYVPFPRASAALVGLYLTERDHPESGPVFLGRGGRLSRCQAWRIVKDAGEKAGLGNIWTHVLRHSCATGLFGAGSDILEVKEYLGHEDIRTTERYLHLEDTRLREAGRSSSCPSNC